MKLELSQYAASVRVRVACAGVLASRKWGYAWYGV